MNRDPVRDTDYGYYSVQFLKCSVDFVEMIYYTRVKRMERKCNSISREHVP